MTIMVYLAVSLHHFDTIVKNDMSWESPLINIIPFLWYFVEPKIFVFLCTKVQEDLGVGVPHTSSSVDYFLHICFIPAANLFT